MAKYVKTEEGYTETTELLVSKMDKDDPVGTGSFSMGRKAGSVVGFYSHAEGNDTTASGAASHAEGQSTKASGAHSHAEGSATTASGGYSHAEGNSTTASGNHSHAEGNTTTASSYSSHAEGQNTTASGDQSHAEGNTTTASGPSSHAEGFSTTASGSTSHAEGYKTTASGAYSHAEGQGTTASGDYSHAEGNSTNKFSSVVTATNPTDADIITAWKSKKFSLAKGSSSHVEGKDNLALADYSHAEGINTTASGSYSHAEGGSTTASSFESHAEGHDTTASGNYSHAEGAYTTASANSSHAEGFVTTASGSSSHAEGSGTKASSREQHVQGKFNIEDSSDTYADIIGNGTSTSARSNAATVDWSGNAWYAGDVYVGSTSGTNKDAGSKKLATEEYVNSVVPEIPSIPTALPNPYALTFTGAVTGSYDGSQAVTVEIPSGSGGESAFRLINTINISEEVSTITIDKDSNGNAFEISEVLIYFDSTTYATADGTFYFRPLGQSSYNMSCYGFISKTAGGNAQRWIYAKHIANGFWRAEFIMNTGHNVPLYSNPGETITSFQLLGQTFAAGNIYIYGR